MSSPGSAIVRIDLPHRLLADWAEGIVWLALGVGFELVAVPALGLLPGAGLVACLAAGMLATRAATRCRHPPMALVVDGGRIGVVTAEGTWVFADSLDGSRVIGPTILVDLVAPAPDSRHCRLWITPHDAPAHALHRLARVLRLHGEPLEA
jgi:hypothetical protein